MWRFGNTKFKRNFKVTISNGHHPSDNCHTQKKMETKSWKKIKDSVYGKIGTERRDGVERDFESFKIGLLLRNAREQKNLTQEQLGKIINKKRSYISRVENDGSNVTMKTLYDIVEKGLGGKVNISFEI